MSPLDDYLVLRLKERAAAGNLRQLAQLPAGIDFFSNDYLGIATLGLLQPYMATPRDGERYGATGSRLLSGNTAAAEQLERDIAVHHRAEAALLFNSGYDANVGLITAIASRHTTILYDALCHASIADGVRLSMAHRKYKFRHNDMAHLTALLQANAARGPVVIITESVFSMDGDIAPLADMAAIANRFDAHVVVDEAHATGIAGASGEGWVCALNLEDQIYARVHTFGKALGCHGAAVVGSLLLKNYLVNFARTFIYTTALPPHAISAISAGYALLSSAGFSHDHLDDLIAYFHRQAGQRQGWKTNGTTPIQIWMSTAGRVTSAALLLQAAGMQVAAIRAPTVPTGQERLRVCLHAFNTPAQIDKLINTIDEL